jgi:RNA polymerase sigma factor (TIGR02999 family)
MSGDTALEIQPTLSSLVDAVERGDTSAADKLFTVLYTELHRLAKRELARQGFAVSLGATTLLHEAYIEIAAREGTSFDRARFMAYAARVMRGLIIDHARSRLAQKRGGRCIAATCGKGLAQRRESDEGEQSTHAPAAIGAQIRAGSCHHLLGTSLASWREAHHASAECA